MLFKKIFPLILIFVSALNFFSCQKENPAKVTVYTYDSFASEWGPAPELARLFKKDTGFEVDFVDCGDAVQAMSRAILEKDNAKADVILGIDNILQDAARNADILEAYKARDAQKFIPQKIRAAFGNDDFFTPYDYSHFAMIFDSKSELPAPACLLDLTRDIYKKKIILIDARTSTPGLGFLAWTVCVFGEGEELENFWRALKPNILAMPPSWSAAWGMFLQGEAPLVISYNTSPAYNVEVENEDRYKALVFEEGHIQQIECCALLKNAPNKKGAKAFIDFIVTKEAQDCLPLTQWMYPANQSAKLPQSFKTAASIPQKTLPLNAAPLFKLTERIMNLLLE